MTSSQRAVKEVLKAYGPFCDQVLVPVAQHVARVGLSSSGIRSRRAELAAAGEIVSVGSVKMPSGRSAVVWGVPDA